MNSPHSNDKNWREEIAVALLPIAKTRAKWATQRFKGDSHIFLSAGNQAITEILNNPANKDKDIDELKALCNGAITYKITDAIRSELGKTGKKIRPYSLDATSPNKDKENDYWVLSINDQGIEAVDISDTAKHIKNLLQFLPPQQYKVICAQIDYKPLGMLDKEIAETIGMKPVTYQSHLKDARDNIKLYFPEVMKSLQELVSDGCHSKAI